MTSQQLREPHRLCLVQTVFVLLCGIAADIVIVHEIGGGRNIDGSHGSILDDNRAVGKRDTGILTLHSHTGVTLSSQTSLNALLFNALNRGDEASAMIPRTCSQSILTSMF